MPAAAAAPSYCTGLLVTDGRQDRVVGPGQAVRIRSDARWSVPEPELAVLINADGAIVGYTIANDMSSRDIEAENPLYLPQAKIYDGSCALALVFCFRSSHPRRQRFGWRLCAKARLCLWGAPRWQNSSAILRS